MTGSGASQVRAFLLVFKANYEKEGRYFMNAFFLYL